MLGIAAMPAQICTGSFRYAEVSGMLTAMAIIEVDIAITQLLQQAVCMSVPAAAQCQMLQG